MTQKSPFSIFVPAGLALALLAPVASSHAQSTTIQGVREVADIVDTLLNPTGQMLFVYDPGLCGEGLEYQVASNAQAEDALCSPDQVTAPMSLLSESRICADDCRPLNVDARSYLMIDSAVTLVRNNNVDDKSCDGELEGFGTEDPVRVLRVLYAGADGSGSTSACNSTERRNLVNNWSAFFEDSCASGNCSEVNHAFRLGDNRGVTEALKETIGITNFCNGSDTEDLDPIRRPCSEDSSVCGDDGTLGLVLAIEIDHTTDSAPDEVNNTRECGRRKFAYARPPFEDRGECPYDKPTIGGLCLYPVDTDGNFGCLAITGPLGSTPPTANPGWDARIYNRSLRRNDGRVIPSTQTGDDKIPFYRLASDCSEGTFASKQIGCIVNRTGCSLALSDDRMNIAYASLETNPKLAPVRINGIDNASRDYPLQFDVYLNTLDGWEFNENNPEEDALSDCIRDIVRYPPLAGRTILQEAQLRAGFRVVPRSDSILAENDISYFCQFPGGN